MSYKSKLFKKIPYLVRDSEHPIYSDSELEKYLVTYFGSKEKVLEEVVSIFHDDKNEGNIVNIETKNTKDVIWYGNEQDNICLVMNTLNKIIKKKQIKHDAEFIKEFTSKILDNQELSKAFKSIIGGSKEDGLFIRAKDRKQLDENIDLLIENIDLLKNIAKEYNIEESSVFKFIENESNIIKKTCRKLNLTYAQLAEEIGYKADTVNSVASRGNVSDSMKKAIEMYLEIKDLKNQLNEYDELKKLLKKAIN